MPSTSTIMQARGTMLASLPIAAAIGVFGIVYGAAARPVIGPGLAVASSALMFSGAAQFTIVALLAAGAAPLGVLGAVTMLAVRHVPLAAVLRPHMRAGRLRRALVSLVLTDETTGLALATDGPVERTVAVCGYLAYAAWLTGTVIGVTGGTLVHVEPLATALFPVLFVGLAALTATSRGDAARAVIAGVAGLALALAWPAAGALGAVAVAIAVAAAVRQP